jgi:class 3 adenylate cyclase
LGSVRNIEELAAGQAIQQRSLRRENGASDQYPVSCRVFSKSFPEGLAAEVLNYHYAGVCLRFQEADVFRVKHIVQYPLQIDFYLGTHLLKSDVPVRVAWHENSMPEMLGLQFLVEAREFIERSRRFRINEAYQPTVSAKDPLDVHRAIYFKVQNFSAKGLLLNTSLTNKHLFPGMILRDSRLSVPGQEVVQVDLKIENARKGDNDATFDLGVSVLNDARGFREAFQTYMSHLVADASLTDTLVDSPDGKKKTQMASGLTFRIISNEKDYLDVLKLRLAGYGYKRKVREGSTAIDQGEGLSNEGMVLGAWLAGKLVASMELRFAGAGKRFRVFNYVDESRFDGLGIDWDRMVEMNKLVIHPEAQGTDVLIGMVQKAHAICMSRNAPDVMLFATDTLRPMYERIGAQSTGVTFPHPSLPGVELSVLVLKKEAFLDGRFMKAEVWKKYYEETNRFYQEYIYKNRAVPMVRSGIVGRLQGFSAKQEKSRVAEGEQNFVLQEKDNLLFVDPKWTKQHISASVILPYLIGGDRLIGSKNIDRILSDLGINRSYFRSQSNWVSIEFLDALMDGYSRFGDIDEISRLSGRLTMDKEIIGLNYYLLKHVLSPELAFRAMTNAVKKFNRTRTFEVEIETGRCIVKVGLTDKSLTPKHRCSDLNWLENINTYISLLTNGRGSARQLASIYDGDSASIFEVTWPVRSESVRLIGRYMQVAALGSAAGALFGWWFGPEAGAGGFVSAVAIQKWVELAVRNRKNQHGMSDVTKRIDDINEENARRYEDLQNAKQRLDKRYLEAQILDESARLIQSCGELAGIHRTALMTVCSKFNFRRAFIMLREEDESVLKTVAIEGVEQNVEKLWGYRVDISAKRDGALFLSSAYHSGQSVVINDVESHFFQLNEQSQSLIKGLGGTAGFVIVPIPEENGSCGVLIAERDTVKDPVRQEDVVVLQRLCQHLGIAIERFGKLEKEQKLRTLFQKYVPQAVLEPLLRQSAPVLGGVQKEIVCMFLDIRGFTRLSSTLPPKIVIEFLNRVFAVVGKGVEDAGGVIDKFLGDGVLAVWGSVPGSGTAIEPILKGIAQMRSDLEALNGTFRSEGLPALSFGIGLHKGHAIVGNIGSQDRLEYTCIGSTVNLASRLEGLCKEYKTTLVVSESSVPQGFSEPGFRLIEAVPIRGLEDRINILVANN